MQRHRFVTAAIAAVILGASATFASADDSSRRADVPDGAEPYLAPGATKVGLRAGDRIYYDDGAMIVTLPTAQLAAWDCPSGWFCLFDGDNGTGARGQWQSPGAWQNLHSYGWGDRANSWRNAMSVGVWVDEDIAGGGWHVCHNPGMANFPAAQKNQASRIYIRAALC